MRGRNDACHCGSGKKYKACHLQQDEETRRFTRKAAEHSLDEDLVAAILRHAVEELEIDLDEVVDLEFPSDPEMPLVLPWLAYMYETDLGPTIAEDFLETHRHRLQSVEVEWIEAQIASWLSIWSCTDVQAPMISVTDLLTGERRVVHEVAGSETMRPGLCVLARVVDYQGKSLFAGMHSQPLHPLDVGEIITVVRKEFRLKKKASIKSVRTFDFAQALLEEWEMMFDEIDGRPKPKLVDNEGNPLLFVKEQYGLKVSRKQVLQILREAGLPEEEPDTFLLLIDDKVDKQQSRVAFIEVDQKHLKVQSLSLPHADFAKERISTMFPTQLEGRKRTVVNPVSGFSFDDSDDEPEDENTPEIRAAVAEVARSWKEKHYHAWMDIPLPALRDLTPREAVKTRAGKERVRRLLEGITLTESHLPESERYDPSPLYKSLHLRKPR